VKKIEPTTEHETKKGKATMSAIAKNCFRPSVEALESRDAPSIFSASSATLHVHPPDPAHRHQSFWQKSNFLLARAFLFSVGEATPEGDLVVQYAKSRVGQAACLPSSPNLTNGMGLQCTDLAEFALHSANCKTEVDFGTTGPNTDYKWGDLALTVISGKIATPGAGFDVLRPGDILQYRDVKIDNPDGSWSTASHHTAIVEQNLGDGKLQILEQNWSDQKGAHHIVRETTIDLSHMTAGTIWAYHPVKN
jgi:hypothetical protein